MTRRLTAALITTGLLLFGVAAAYAASGGVPGKGSDRSAAAKQYGERPGKGCGDRNHVHTGPPGNPSNTSCPPQSQHSGSGGGSGDESSGTATARHSATATHRRSCGSHRHAASKAKHAHKAHSAKGCAAHAKHAKSHSRHHGS